MRLKPAAGRAVRDPVKGTLLPEEGAEIQLDAFWRRRKKDGDVVEVTEDVTATASETVVTDSATGTTDTEEATS